MNTIPAPRPLVILLILALTGCGEDRHSSPHTTPDTKPAADRTTYDVTPNSEQTVPPQFSFPWFTGARYEPLSARVPTPPGFERIAAENTSFAAWLRALPILPGRPDVHLFDGRKKDNQDAHHAVLAVDVGPADLQQCADAVIRLRAEYLYARGLDDAITFRFTSGHLAEWAKWRDGFRPQVRGNQVSWSKAAAAGRSYANFRRYLDTVFTYAGTASLSRELAAVPDPAQVQPGDVFIQGGHPGHAVIVVDVAADAAGRRIFLIAQSYMPAQEIHLLRNPASPACPWYPAASAGTLVTPEWTFRYEDLRRFTAPRTP